MDQKTYRPTVVNDHTNWDLDDLLRYIRQIPKPLLVLLLDDLYLHIYGKEGYWTRNANTESDTLYIMAVNWIMNHRHISWDQEKQVLVAYKEFKKLL